MSKIWVSMGYSNRPDLTNRSLEVLGQNTKELNLILIDNGCGEEVEVPKNTTLKFIQNPRNIGCLPMLNQSLYCVEDDDILVFMHNDVLIWKEGWDVFVRDAFNAMPTLGLAGLFGAPGVATDGGRIFARSRMEGREWGTEGELHGAIMPLDSISPASVLDSLCMIFRVSALKEIGIPPEWPPHHWFDRLFCLRMIENGWRVAVFGIPFDHYGGGSSGATMDTFAIDWVKDKTGTVMNPVDANNYLYTIGANIFIQEYGDKLSLITDGWDYIWRTHRQ